jgi:hypothetical protein
MLNVMVFENLVQEAQAMAAERAAAAEVRKQAEEAEKAKAVAEILTAFCGQHGVTEAQAEAMGLHVSFSNSVCVVGKVYEAEFRVGVRVLQGKAVFDWKRVHHDGRALSPRAALAEFALEAKGRWAQALVRVKEYLDPQASIGGYDSARQIAVDHGLWATECVRALRREFLTARQPTDANNPGGDWWSHWMTAAIELGGMKDQVEVVRQARVLSRARVAIQDAVRHYNDAVREQIEELSPEGIEALRRMPEEQGCPGIAEEDWFVSAIFDFEAELESAQAFAYQKAKRAELQAERFHPFVYYRVCYVVLIDSGEMTAFDDGFESLAPEPDGEGWWTTVHGDRVKTLYVARIDEMTVMGPDALPWWCPWEETEYGRIQVPPAEAMRVEVEAMA